MLNLFKPIRYFAEDDATAGGGEKPSEKPADKPAEKPADKAYSQADVDALMDKVRATERKKAVEDQKAETAKATMTETEKLKAEKAESDKKASDAQTAANQRVIAAEAKVAAVAAGVKPEQLRYVLKLADLSAVEMGDDGEPDASAIKAAVEAVLKDVPALKGGKGADSKAGSEFGGTDGLPTLTEEVISKMNSDEMKARMPEIEAFYRNKKK